MDEFGVTHAVHGNCYVFRVSGHLDGDTAPWLERELEQLQTQLPVVIDLSDASFVNSTGIVALLRERPFGRPTLVCPDGTPTARVLDIVGAERLVPVYNNLVEALTARTAA